MKIEIFWPNNATTMLTKVNKNHPIMEAIDNDYIFKQVGLFPEGSKKRVVIDFSKAIRVNVYDDEDERK